MTAMKKKMVKLFLYWITERQKIYLKKENGDPWPWTKDKILQEYKFTNPFRQNDAVTKALTRMVVAPHKNEDLSLLFANICIFRMFNRPETYEILGGWRKSWNNAYCKKVLHKHKDKGGKVFTGAYIITNGGGTQPKIDYICDAVSNLWKWRETIAETLIESASLEKSTQYLCGFPAIGKFIAYELVTDFRHTPILNKATDIYTWANPGPGAIRGMHRILFNTERGKLPKGKKVDYQETMRSLIPLAEEAFNEMYKVGVGVRVSIEMRDIEHSLCEFDKYMRVKNNEGRPRSKYRRVG